MFKSKSQRGNATLEFAAGWFLLWLLFSGVYRFGYSFYTYNVLKTAVANAAMLGARIDYDADSTTSYMTSVKNMVVYGDTTSTGHNAIINGLGTGNVNVTVTTDANTIPKDVTVSITGFTVNTFFSTWTLSGKPRATVQYFGRVLCSTCACSGC